MGLESEVRDFCLYMIKNLRAIWETQVRSLGQEEPLEKEWWLRRLSICLQCRRPGFDLWVGNFPWRRKWQPTPVFLPRKCQRQRSLVGYHPEGRKESDTWARTQARHIKRRYPASPSPSLSPSPPSQSFCDPIAFTACFVPFHTFLPTLIKTSKHNFTHGKCLAVISWKWDQPGFMWINDWYVSY